MSQSMHRIKNTQAGLTLIELMVAMVISSIIIFFLFSIQSRMSRAYQGQSTVSEINQNLQSAKQLLLGEIRMAGFGLVAGTGTVEVASTVDSGGIGALSGFSVVNNAAGDGNDTFRILFTDADSSIVVVDVPVSQVFVRTEDVPPPLPIGQPVILKTAGAACLVAVTLVVTGGKQVKFQATPVGKPYNETPENPHCDAVRQAMSDNPGQRATIETFSSRSYRIDPTRTTEGYLQMSPSGEVVANDWIDMGAGFTNLQVATRYFESGDTVDSDGDGDPERDWYSSDNQATPDPTLTSDKRPATAVLIQASLSIEARSPYGTRGAAASATTPAYTDLTNVKHNPFGDWGVACAGAVNDPCGVNLATTPDASRPDRYKGDFIYRSISSIIDLRNMGVGN